MILSHFEKMVVLGPTRFTEDTRAAFSQYARIVDFDPIVPASEEALTRRMQGADALLVSMEVQVTRKAIEATPTLRYIGMCCSLYGPESANVDILTAQSRGIVVTGIRDYGDMGVVEYVISELVQLFHGFREHMWRPEPTELNGATFGIIGMGGLGKKITAALRFFGAKVVYFSRTRKPEIEAQGVSFLPLNELLPSVDVCICCLNKNAVLLHEKQFQFFGNGKILMNIAIGTCSDNDALAKWLSNSANLFLCDSPLPLGDPRLLSLPNVLCVCRGAGFSTQMVALYNEKILSNIRDYLSETNACEFN